MAVVTLTKENFDETVLGSKKPVLVDFWASWCGPCRMQSPIVDAAAEHFGDAVLVGKLNVDEQPTVAADFSIASIPTLIFIKDGAVCSRYVGLQDQETIEEVLSSLLDA